MNVQKLAFAVAFVIALARSSTLLALPKDTAAGLSSSAGRPPSRTSGSSSGLAPFAQATAETTSRWYTSTRIRKR
ncbi:MAG: hypothetical protein FJ291_23730 [Planctomycetes bacterium]|nr:hypothetical protein [Planctomycetota bacterium]